MRHAASLVVLGLTLNVIAAGADSADCGVSKGLYEGWQALVRPASTHKAGAAALMENAPNAVSGAEKLQEIAREYQAFFRCLSDTAARQEKDAVLARCRQVEGDRIATLACRTAAYLKSGRTDGKDFLDALPATKKGAEAIWDLDAIAGGRHEDPA